MHHTSGLPAQCHFAAQTCSSSCLASAAAILRSTSMNLLSPEQLASTQKANLDAMFVLASKSFDGWQKLVELNLRTARSSLAEAQEHALKALPSSDPQTALA